MTNPSAGQSAALPAQNISTGIIEAVSWATSERLSEAAGEQGARLTPEVAVVIGDPVRAEVTEAQPVGPDSGNGQSPFFLSFLANLSALIGGLWSSSLPAAWQRSSELAARACRARVCGR